MILKVFSNPNDSMILYMCVQPDICPFTLHNVV